MYCMSSYKPRLSMSNMNYFNGLHETAVEINTTIEALKMICYATWFRKLTYQYTYGL